MTDKQPRPDAKSPVAKGSGARTAAAGVRALTASGVRATRTFFTPDQILRVGLDPERVAHHEERNRRQTLLLFASMAVLLLIAASLLAGLWGVVVMLLAVIAMVLIGPRVSPETVMQAYRGQPLTEANGRTFVGLMSEIAGRAELPAVPALYVIPSATLNAFAVGTPAKAAIAVTEGLIRRLSLRELAGVLAHETAHIRNGDLWIMGLADGMTRLARGLSIAALLLMGLNLIALLTGADGLSWPGLLLLYLAPMASSLLQLGLSRTREYDADLDGVGLTGDPEALASALAKLEPYTGRVWEDLIHPMRRVPHPSVLRSHPATADRVARLRDLAAAPAPTGPTRPRLVVVEGPLVTSLAGHGASGLTPRYRRRAGVWF